jgi:hypothetical protein
MSFGVIRIESVKRGILLELRIVGMLGKWEGKIYRDDVYIAVLETESWLGVKLRQLFLWVRNTNWKRL